MSDYDPDVVRHRMRGRRTAAARKGKDGKEKPDYTLNAMLAGFAILAALALIVLIIGLV